MTFKSLECKLKENAKLFACIFSTVSFRNFFSAAISINVFALNRVSSKFAEKKLTNNNCIT